MQIGFFLKKIFSFLQLLRYQNLLITTFTLFFSNLFLVGQSNAMDFGFLALVLSTVFVAGGGYLINDLYDIKIDLYNKPDSVLIGSVFSKRWVIITYFLINSFALLLGFFVSNMVGLIDIACIFSLWLYAFWLKKMPLYGNVLVALLSAMVVLMLNIFYHNDNQEVYLLAIFAFFISLIREIVKDMEDIEGDKVGGCNTFPIVFGIKNSKFLIGIILIFFLLFLEFYSLIFNELHANIVYQFCMPISLLFFAYRLYSAQNKSEFHQLSSLCKLLMLFGLIGVIT